MLRSLKNNHCCLHSFAAIVGITVIRMGGWNSLVVMGGASCSRGREFESQYHMVIFSNIYLLSSFAFVFEKTENS